VPEARVLAEAGDREPPGEAEAREAEAREAPGAAGGDAERLVRAVHALGPRAVVLTGGHREEASDLFFDGDQLVEIPGQRYADGAAHGSGCTHSSALAAHLALGFEPPDAPRAAKRIASEAVRDGLRGIGEGAGPVDVFGLEQRRR
jgi:hydroxymethylpyrimidine/phosphomethylpyrimidine kinase